AWSRSAPASPVSSPAVSHICLRMLVEQRDAALETLRKVNVVRVEKRNEVAAGMSDAQISRGTHTAVLVPWMVEIPHPRRISSGQMPCDRRAFVRGSVVDEDQLPMGKRLGVNARDRFLDEP